MNACLKRKSLFFFGPRQTGKSTFLKATYPNALYIDLLKNKTYNEYLREPQLLEVDIQSYKKKTAGHLIIIDEIQKLPNLLDEVHSLIESDKSLRFILTGSSARKLKRLGSNLLGGRAAWFSFYPLTFIELQHNIKFEKDLERRLNHGGLPTCYSQTEAFEELKDYVGLYLKTEIQDEGLVRNIENFGRFLEASALTNAKQLNYTEIGSDAQVPPRTVQNYFQILEDTLVGFLLPAFTKTKTRKAISTAKFYLFDTGVTNSLLHRKWTESGTIEFGELFEQFIINEILAYKSYAREDWGLSYWRSTSQFEVDLILDNHQKHIAIEIKGKNKVTKKDCSGLLAFEDDIQLYRKIIIYTGDRVRKLENGIELLPYKEFFKQLWHQKLF